MNSVELVPACYSDLAFIARNMRDQDAEEILPLVPGQSAENLAYMTLASGGISTVALWKGQPVAAFGACEAQPQFWKVWMFATDNWPRVALSVTKNILRVIRSEMIDSGAVRADCWSIEGHTTAHCWLEMLGAVREATLEDYGPTRKRFHCYSWTRSRLERENNVHISQPSITPAAAADPGTAASGKATNPRRSGGKRRGRGSPPPPPSGAGPELYDSGGLAR